MQNRSAFCGLDLTSLPMCRHSGSLEELDHVKNSPQYKTNQNGGLAERMEGLGGQAGSAGDGGADGAHRWYWGSGGIHRGFLGFGKV